MARKTAANQRKVKARLPRLERVDEVEEVEDDTQSTKKHGESSRATNNSLSRKTILNATAANKSITTKYIQNRILKLMPDCKRSCKHPKIIKKLNEVFYKERSSLETASMYQKAFSSILLRIMIVPFKSDRCPQSERVIKLFTEVILNFGVDDDKLAASFTLETNPLFFEILKYLMKEYVLFEDRQNVRLRVVELVEKILTAHNEHPLLSDAEFRDKIREVIGYRIRDKYALVRAKTALALRFFLENKDTKKGVKYSALYDPNAEVRKYSVLSLKGCDSISTDFFCGKAFDRSPVVAIEALKVVRSRPMSLSPTKMQTLLLWGLKHYNVMLRRHIMDDLIPIWLEKSKGVVNFLLRLDLSYKPKTTSCILDGIIRENTEEYFETIDKSFLNEDKIIPINEISLEKMIYWLFLCSKFKDKKYCLDKLLPTSANIIIYLTTLIDKIHEENQIAEEECREEEATYLLCLTHAIRITGLCPFEESTRRQLEDLLISILIDPILDEAPLLVVATDTLHKIVDSKRFQEIITNVIQDIFDPTEPNNCSTSRRRANSFNASPRRSMVIENGGDGDNSFSEDSPHFNPVDASTPFVKNGRTSLRSAELKEEEKCRLKEKLAALGYERNKLIGKRDSAKEANDFLEGGRLHEEIGVLLKKERDLRNLLGLEEAEKPMSKEHESLGAQKIAKDLARTHDSLLLKGKGASQINHQCDVIESQPINSQSPKISDSGLLRGIVIGTRFLICQKEVIPSIRQFIDNEISRPLLSEDARVRIHTLQLLCMFAMYDKREARKVMTAQLRALSMDTPEVQVVAYKCVVDLLLTYKFEEFKFSEGDDVWSDLPDCLNDSNATKEDLESYFLLKLASDDTENNTIRHLECKTEGMLKLLLRGCVTINSESLISKLLCMWVNPNHAGSSICSNISNWLPRYSCLSVINAKRVSKGLMLSLERVLTDGEPDEEQRVSNIDNAMKLFELVLPSISSPSIQQSPDGRAIQSLLAVDILNLILQNVQWEFTFVISRMLSHLDVSDAVLARNVVKLIGQYLVVTMGFPKTASISRTKAHVNSLHKKLSKKFEGLPTLDELKNDSDLEEVDNPSPCDALVFSDSSQSDIFDKSEIEDSPPGKNSRPSGEINNVDLNVSPAKSDAEDSSEMDSRVRERNNLPENFLIPRRSRKRSCQIDNVSSIELFSRNGLAGLNVQKRRKLSRYDSTTSLSMKTRTSHPLEIERRKTRSMSVA